MKNNITNIILIGLLLVAILFWFRISNLREDNSRMSENMKSLYDINKKLVLNQVELKDYLVNKHPLLLKAIGDSIGRKVSAGNINNISETNISYGDTNIIELPVIQIDNVYPFEYKDSCWGVKGIFDINSSMLTITSREADNQVVAVDYVKREKIMKWFFGGIALGKKKAGIFIQTKCGAATRTEIDVKD